VAGLRDAVGPDVVVSVDLNYRPRLWQGRETAPLRALIGQADLLFAGRDEMEAFLGHADPERVFAEHPRVRAVVVKDDALRASSYERDGAATHVPCLAVDVVEPVGAGDAFAAGYLAALAEGRDDASALRLGHALAALTLVSHGDRPVTVPDASERDAIAGASHDEWSTWRIAAGAAPWRRG
jgi:2-dehydro-3-deoxygluconokinase